MATPDPLTAALDALEMSGDNGKRMKIDVLFGDRPDVLDSIRRARRDRRVTFVEIAKKLSAAAPIEVGATAVASWLHSQGIE
jgi:hypothetical protein